MSSSKLTQYLFHDICDLTDSVERGHEFDDDSAEYTSSMTDLLRDIGSDLGIIDYGNGSTKSQLISTMSTYLSDLFHMPLKVVFAYKKQKNVTGHVRFKRRKLVMTDEDEENERFYVVEFMEIEVSEYHRASEADEDEHKRMFKFIFKMGKLFQKHRVGVKYVGKPHMVKSHEEDKEGSIICISMYEYVPVSLQMYFNYLMLKCDTWETTPTLENQHHDRHQMFTMLQEILLVWLPLQIVKFLKKLRLLNLCHNNLRPENIRLRCTKSTSTGTRTRTNRIQFVTSGYELATVSKRDEYWHQGIKSLFEGFESCHAGPDKTYWFEDYGMPQWLTWRRAFLERLQMLVQEQAAWPHIQFHLGFPVAADFTQGRRLYDHEMMLEEEKKQIVLRSNESTKESVSKSTSSSSGTRRKGKSGHSASGTKHDVSSGDLPLIRKSKNSHSGSGTKRDVSSGDLPLVRK